MPIDLTLLLPLQRGAISVAKYSLTFIGGTIDARENKPGIVRGVSRERAAESLRRVRTIPRLATYK